MRGHTACSSLPVFPTACAEAWQAPGREGLQGKDLQRLNPDLGEGKFHPVTGHEGTEGL